jgi:hypothetical protein
LNIDQTGKMHQFPVEEKEAVSSREENFKKKK